MNTEETEYEALGNGVLAVVMGSFSAGDYVLATKYSDADPHDRWRVDFIKSVETFANGKTGILFEETGVIPYYYAKKITEEEGKLIISAWEKNYP